jgi:ribonuclease HII
MLTKYIDDLEIGIDEAGRGCLFGRVYSAAVIWDDKINNDIKDSKKINKIKRKQLSEWIKNNTKAWGVGWAESNEIDDINILEATTLAMNRAINNLKFNFNLNNIDTIIIDGIGWNNKFPNYNVYSLVKGDNKLYSIAAASILAKVYHDEYINDLCSKEIELNTHYDLLSNMGYGTKKHMDGLYKYGISDYHRKTFNPCNHLIIHQTN